MKKLLFGIVFACSLIGVNTQAEEAPLKDELNFIVLGDWGRAGSREQRLVAAQMNRLAAAVALDFIVTTGDNFYMKGVKSSLDPLWQKAFKSVYSLPALKHLRWYVALGNHDYMGNIYAQMEYARNHSEWILPATYYSRDFPLAGNSKARLLFIDSNAFVEKYRENPQTFHHIDKQDSAAQLHWLKTQLQNSTAQWRIVIGHHPVYSAGRHGDTAELKALLPGLFEQYGVQAYFAGHDHHLEYHQPAGSTAYIISGGGSKKRGINKAHQSRFAASSLGFAYVRLDADCMRVQFINEKGRLLYESEHSSQAQRRCSGDAG